MEQKTLEKLTIAEKKIAFERQTEQRLNAEESLLRKQTELNEKRKENEMEELRLLSEKAKEERDRAKKAADFKLEQEMESRKMEIEEERKERESRRKIAENEAKQKCMAELLRAQQQLAIFKAALNRESVLSLRSVCHHGQCLTCVLLNGSTAN